MALARQPMTADEYLALPPLDQYRRLELIDGELVVNEPKVGHQKVVLWLAHKIAQWIEAGPDRGSLLTPDVRMSDRDVFSPNLVWVPTGFRYPDDDGALLVPPALAVEVRSPSTWRQNRTHKRRLYAAGGIAELWLVDHLDGFVEVHRRSSPDAATFDEQVTLRAGDTLTTPLLPGLALDLASLFARAAER